MIKRRKEDAVVFEREKREREGERERDRERGGRKSDRVVGKRERG